MSRVLSDGTCVIEGVTHVIRKSASPYDPYVWYSTFCDVVRFDSLQSAKVDAAICFDRPLKTPTCIQCMLEFTNA